MNMNPSTPSPVLPTPTPWKTQRVSRLYGCYGHEITKDHGSVADRAVPLAFIAADTDEDRANAALIVTACNALPALADALAGLLALCEKRMPSTMSRIASGDIDSNNPITAARAALALLPK